MSSAITKAFTVLRLLRRNGSAMTVTEVSKSVRVAASTAHAILNELQAQGAVVQDPDKRYRLGPTSFYLGAAFARNASIYRAAWADLAAIAGELSLSAVVAIPWENHHLMLAVHRGESDGVDVAFGGRVPIDAGSFGKAYYAWSGEGRPMKLHQYTPGSITDPEAYAKEIDLALYRGFATDSQEFTNGVGAVASAVTSERGYEGLAALIGPLAQVSDIGFDTAGRRLAGLVSRASFALGDLRRMKVVGIE